MEICRQAAGRRRKPAPQAARRKLREEYRLSRLVWKAWQELLAQPRLQRAKMKMALLATGDQQRASRSRWKTSASNTHVGSAAKSSMEMVAIAKIEDGKDIIGFFDWMRYTK